MAADPEYINSCYDYDETGCLWQLFIIHGFSEIYLLFKRIKPRGNKALSPCTGMATE